MPWFKFWKRKSHVEPSHVDPKTALQHLLTGEDVHSALESLEKHQASKNLGSLVEDLAYWEKVAAMSLEEKYQSFVVAAGQGDVGVVKEYLTMGIDPDCVDFIGRTALHATLQQGHVEVVSLLLTHAANPHIPRRDGWSPMKIAKHRENSAELVALLKEAGAQDE